MTKVFATSHLTVMIIRRGSVESSRPSRLRRPGASRSGPWDRGPKEALEPSDAEPFVGFGFRPVSFLAFTLLLLSAEKDGTIAARRVAQQDRLGTPKPSRIGGELEVETGGDLRDALGKLLGELFQVSGSDIHREEMELPRVERGVSVDDVSIDVHKHIGLVELGMASEEFRGEHNLPNGGVHPIP